MLTIRLIRTGKRNAPAYRVVLIQKIAPPKSGKFLEILGSYNPRLKELNLKADRIKYWISKGAGISDTVHNLLVDEKILTEPKLKAWRPKRAKAKSSDVSTEAKEAKVEAPSEAKSEGVKEAVKEEPKEEIKTEEKKPEKEPEKEVKEPEPEEKVEEKKEKKPKEKPKEAAPKGGEPRPEKSGREKKEVKEEVKEPEPEKKEKPEKG